LRAGLRAVFASAQRLAIAPARLANLHTGFGDLRVTPVDLTAAAVLAQQGPGGGLEILNLFLPLGIIVVLYFVLIQGPQRKEQRARMDMLQNMKKNDKVLTNSGIFGVVTNVQSDNDEVTIRVDETTNTKLRVLRSSIARVLAEDVKKDGETPS
jgi:preprotein translocase subunit YajC